MKKRIYAILGLLIPAMAVAENTPVKYADAANLTIVNKAQPGGSAFQRIEVARYPELTPTVTRYYRYSTGLAVAFRTDSRNIRARWTTVNQLPGANSTLIAQRGLDLYIRRDGKCQERTKCRVEYTREVLKVEYVPYRMRPVHSLRLVTCDEIDYSYKSTDRQCLNDLFAQRAGHDDILIIRDGLLTDTSICNVALWNGTSWITPARPLLCGTMRAYLLDKGLVQAEDIPVEDLPKYTRIRLFNALIEFGEIDEITRIYV